MIDKIAHAIHSIGPGAIRILILQNEIQIPFCYSPVVILGENLEALVSKNAR